MPNAPDTDRLAEKIVQADPYLKPFEKIIERRIQCTVETEVRLTGEKQTLVEFAGGKNYFGLHFEDQNWVLREWAPHATAIYLVGTVNHWQEREAFKFSRVNEH